jgi:hypothetical protein
MGPYLGVHLNKKELLESWETYWSQSFYIKWWTIKF